MTKQEKILEAKKLLEQYAPKGEFLAYINKDEANLLKERGGSGRMTPAGIPTFGGPLWAEMNYGSREGYEADRKLALELQGRGDQFVATAPGAPVRRSQLGSWMQHNVNSPDYWQKQLKSGALDPEVGLMSSRYAGHKFDDPKWMAETQGFHGGSQITKDLLRGVFDKRAEAGDLGFFEGDTPAARQFHAVSEGAGVDYNDWLEGSPMMENKAMNEARATQKLQFEDWKDQQFPLSTGIGSGGTGTYNVGQGGYTNTNTVPLGGSGTGGLGGSGTGGVLGGGGWKPFMTDDEASQYYGGFAHGGPVALRRKMFSMGGDVDRSHGVGLTSGLTKTVPPKRGPMPQGFQTGGHVVPQRVGHQPANHPHRQGNREGHMGILKTIGKGILESLNPNIWKKVPGGAADEAAEAAGKGAKEVVDEWDEVAKKLGGSGSKITKEVFESLPPSLKRKLLRAGMVGGTYGGITSALLPKTDIENAESDAEKALGIGRETLELLSAISPVGQVGNIASNLYQAFKPSGESDYTLTPAQAIRNAMGTTGADIVADQDSADLSPVGKIAEEISQEEMIKAEYQQKVDLFKDLLGQGNEGENNWSTVSDALVRSGSALTSGKGWGDAMSAFHEPISTELATRRQRHENINQAATTQAMSEMFTGDQTDRAADLTAWAGGDYGFTNIRAKMDEALAKGITATVPLDDGAKWDQEATAKQKGTVFLNPEKVAGNKFFVAVNKSGVIDSFDDIDEALKFAESK